MNTDRKRITGCLKKSPPGFAIVTETGDHWILEDCDPSNHLIDTHVTAEGTTAGLDRLHTEWLGTPTS